MKTYMYYLAEHLTPQERSIVGVAAQRLIRQAYLTPSIELRDMLGYGWALAITIDPLKVDGDSLFNIGCAIGNLVEGRGDFPTIS